VQTSSVQPVNQIYKNESHRTTSMSVTKGKGGQKMAKRKAGTLPTSIILVSLS